MKDKLIFFGVLVVLLSGLIYIAIAGAQKINQAAQACKQSGGIQLRTYDGFACVQSKKIELNKG